jgi:cell division protein FtsL
VVTHIQKIKTIKESKMAEEVKEVKPLSRSEREAQIKDKAGLVIVIMALFMAITTYFSNMHSGAGLKNMLKATDTYSFFQSKSIKQTIAEGQRDDYLARGEKDKAAKLQEKIDRYESDPVKGEGKKELLAKAQAYEAARDEASRHSPWLTFASMAFQLAIVLLSASILSVNNKMYKISEVVAVIGIALLSQGIWLWF